MLHLFKNAIILFLVYILNYSLILIFNLSVKLILNMELLDLVSTVLDLSNKGSEYNEEFKGLFLTV